MAITDDIGDVIRDYEYDVYGRVAGGSGSTPNEFDFAGQQSDDSTGLRYLRARYYDRETGASLSRNRRLHKQRDSQLEQLIGIILALVVFAVIVVGSLVYFATIMGFGLAMFKHRPRRHHDE